MAQTIPIVDFSGGLSNLSPIKLAENESAVLQNAIGIEGNLQTYQGNLQFNSALLPGPVTALYTYCCTDGTSRLVAVSGGYVWLDVTGAGDFRPITACQSGQEVIFAQVGQYLYIANTAVNGELLRFSGVWNYSGTVTEGGTDPTTGGTIINTTATSWQTGETLANGAFGGPVKPGDAVFVYNTTYSTWQCAGYVMSVTGPSSLILHLPTVYPAFAAGAKYVIARIGGAGIPQPTSQLQVTFHPTGWNISTVDTSLTAPYSPRTSVAIGNSSSPYPQIAYFDSGGGGTLGRLRYAYWDHATSAWVTSTVDDIGTGEYCSIALDSSNLPGIAYYDTQNMILKYAKFDGTNWNISVVSSQSAVGLWPSLSFNSSGYPVIACYVSGASNAVINPGFELTPLGVAWTFTGTNQGITSSPVQAGKHSWYSSQYPGTAVQDNIPAHAGGIYTSGVWAYVNGDSANTVQMTVQPKLGSTTVGPLLSGTVHGSITPDTWTQLTDTFTLPTGIDNVKITISLVCHGGSGGGSINIDDITFLQQSGLQLATYSGSTWACTWIDQTAGVGPYLSMALDASNYAHVAYYRPSQGLVCATNATGSWVYTTVDSAATAGTAVALAMASGNPHIAYANISAGPLKMARYNGTAWTLSTIENGTSYGICLGLAIDSSGYDYVTYFEGSTNIASYASWNGTIWTIKQLQSNGQYASIALDSVPNPGIAFIDTSQGALKYETTANLGSGLSAGAYQYTYTFADSVSGYESDPFDITRVNTITTSGTQSVDITLPTAALDPGWGLAGGILSVTDSSALKIDTINIDRTVVGGSVFFLVSSTPIFTRSQTGYTFSAQPWTDSTFDADLQQDTEVSIVNAQPPNGLVGVVSVNNRLWGWGVDTASNPNGFTPSSYMFSTLNQYEYWPDQSFDPNNLLGYEQDSGGYINVGQDGATITAVIPEGISFLSTQSPSMIIFRSSGEAYRLYGYDWSSFNLVDAFTGDCFGQDAVASGQGFIFWISKDGPMALPLGAIQPIPIYEKLFPANSNPFSGQINWAAAAGCCAMMWRKWFTFAYPSAGSSVNDTCYALYGPSLAAGKPYWMQIGAVGQAIDVGALSVRDGNSEEPVLYYGDSTTGQISAMFTESDGESLWGVNPVTWEWVSRMYSPPAKDDRTVTSQRIEEIAVLVRNPGASVEITASLYVNGSTTPTATQQMYTDPTGDAWQWLMWAAPGPGSMWGYQFGLSGTTNLPIIIESIRLRSIVVGNAI